MMIYIWIWIGGGGGGGMFAKAGPAALSALPLCSSPLPQWIRFLCGGGESGEVGEG